MVLQIVSYRLQSLQYIWVNAEDHYAYTVHACGML
jgi:hypothetical protein